MGGRGGAAEGGTPTECGDVDGISLGVEYSKTSRQLLRVFFFFFATLDGSPSRSVEYNLFIGSRLASRNYLYRSYRGTSLIRNRTQTGRHSEAMPRA